MLTENSARSDSLISPRPSSVSPSSVSPSSAPPSSPIATSRIRDHLANERTYLAWMRTAIALMGFGVVMARLRSLLAAGTIGTGQGRLLGLIFTTIGLLTILLSTQHYLYLFTSSGVTIDFLV